MHINDIIRRGDFGEKIERLKGVLAKEFEVKELGELKYFQGNEEDQSKSGIAVSQRKYTLDLLKETRMLWLKLAETHMEVNKCGLKQETAPIDTTRYQNLVGKLIHLTHNRHGISFPIKLVSQFMNKLNEEHLKVIYRIQEKEFFFL